MPEKLLLRRREVMELLGAGWRIFRKATGPDGVLKPVYLQRDNKGRPKGGAFYRRRDVLKLVGK